MPPKAGGRARRCNGTMPLEESSRHAAAGSDGAGGHRGDAGALRNERVSRDGRQAAAP